MFSCSIKQSLIPFPEETASGMGPDNDKYVHWSFGGLPGVALFLLMPLLRRRLQDATIVMIGCLTAAIAELYTGLCTKTWMIFIGKYLAPFY